MLQRIWIACLIALIILAGSVSPADPARSEQIVSHIPHQAVESTVIAAVGYSKRRHILEIQFVNRAVYRYLDVSPTVYRELMSANSKARYYDKNIRGNYRSLRVRPRQREQTQN